MPITLNSRDLIVNNTKTGEYTVRQNINEWKKCKLLESYLDTETDIKNRKGKLFNAADQLKEICINDYHILQKLKHLTHISLQFFFINLNCGHLLKPCLRVLMHPKGKY